uniref:Uncharacterized protein n=1 Tax=Rhizophora mucronata TaxID=61149 RepID=A0A2P2R2R0_RHIMU
MMIMTKDDATNNKAKKHQCRMIIEYESLQPQQQYLVRVKDAKK